jgi:hypothetical protein
MEKIMFKMKNTKLSSIFLLISLMIISVFLAACEPTSDASAAPISLQAPAADTLIESDTADVSQISEPTNDALPSTTSAEPTEVQTAGGHDNSNQARIADRSEHEFDPSTAPEISQEEMDGLVYMREEEKLARDVYLTLYEQWGIPVFQNIAGSEQAHMDSVLMLLEQYGQADPAAGLGVGEFSDPLFQSLYEDLVAQGSLSQADALIVGATIEDLDIYDLQELLDETENEYIVQVYNNLLAGSENHMRAFVSNLERQAGATYQPVYIDQDTYQAIINGSMGQGSAQGGSGQSGHGQGGNGNQGGGGHGSGRAQNNNA